MWGAAHARCRQAAQGRGSLTARSAPIRAGTTPSTGIDVVVHLAGLAHLPDEMAAAAADTFARVNAEGTARLAAAAVARRRAPIGAHELGPGAWARQARAGLSRRATLRRRQRPMRAPSSLSEAAARGVGAGMGRPAPADGVWAGSPRQLPPAGAARARRRAAAAGRGERRPRASSASTTGRCRGARSRASARGGPGLSRCRCGDHVDRRPGSSHRRRAPPPHLDASCTGSASANRARARRPLARCAAPVRSARARHQPHPHAARLVAAGLAGGGRAPRRNDASSKLTPRPDRWARGSHPRAGWSRSPCRRRPSARRTWLPSCRPCARPRRGWRCSSRSRW